MRLVYPLVGSLDRSNAIAGHTLPAPIPRASSEFRLGLDKKVAGDRDPLFRHSRKCGDRNDTDGDRESHRDKVKDARASMTIAIGHTCADKRESE